MLKPVADFPLENLILAENTQFRTSQLTRSGGTLAVIPKHHVKMQPEIRIEALHIDEHDSDFTKFRIYFANDNISTSFEFYNYLNCFDEFSKKLQAFPLNAKDIIEFQVGENSEKWAYYMNLKISCEPNGSSAIHIKLDNHEKDLDLVKTEFFIKTLPASLNKFGQILSSWKPKEQKQAIWVTE